MRKLQNVLDVDGENNYMMPSELYPVEKLGNCKEFEQWLMSQVEKENERGKVNHWRRFLEIYFAQLTFIQIDPSSEQYESVEMYPTIKRIERNVSDRFKGKIYRWGIEQVKIGHYRILYTVYDHYKILLVLVERVPQLQSALDKWTGEFRLAKQHGLSF